MSEILERRVRVIRSRAKVRAWQYRQRRHAQGVWYRLRRTLTYAESAWIIPAATAEALLKEGFRREPVGDELEPRKTILFVTRERLSAIDERREIPVSLGASFFTAPVVALIAFPIRRPRDPDS